MEKGKLLIISGFSGVGKGTVVKRLLDKYSNYRVSVSATTREPREGEENGIHYFFKSIEEFEEMIEKNQLLEYADYVGNYYGTPKEFVERQLENGIHVILEIETKGALKVKEQMPEALLVGRNTETHEVIEKRLMKAAEETESMKDYEYFVVNDEIDKCVDNINKIITDSNPELLTNDCILEIKNDILKFSKGE